MSDWTLYLGNCVEGLAALAPRSAALLLTDVPYAVSREGGDIKRNGGSVLKQDFFETDRDPVVMGLVLRDALQLCLRALADDGAAYVWCGHAQFGFIETTFRAAGFKTGFLAWHKTSPAPSVRKAGWVSTAELCVWGRAPGNSFTFTEHAEMLNVFHCASLRNGSPGKTEHPTQKPLDVIEPIVLAQSSPGDLVIDPFAGSATTGVACKRTGRRFVGWEIDPHFHSMGARRLAETAYQYDLIPRTPKPKQQGLGFTTGEAPQALSNSSRPADPEEAA